MVTEQMEFWQGKFGQEYTERSTFTPKEIDLLYVEQYGISRTDMNKSFLDSQSINRILEVGCNTGNQLLHLQSNGYEHLYGIELQSYAVEKSKGLSQRINIIQGSAFDIPYKDSYFDLVYTCGVLIHVAPDDINKALQEIYRTSKRYIWGFEYYSGEYEEINYRGHEGKLWRTNFVDLYLKLFPDLKLIKEQKYPYLTKEKHVDQMFLLEKPQS
ncbi:MULTISPECIES: pseudaminic acid biosynthesis-associated methylase [Paenibacillus]|uniref:Methyltransferase domain-containing protein n=1 Tax=Paenibacillus radicis (ex Xue et al. 2023) TaxID=2972489 RepID=A0ABT1YGP9_9BACL|nr:pseudaminic acid biosynthesis-associated methylase [Paenibacillus radicis (ex Xue et al. 2023)]MCR8632374.1 methyltransferase domain-containing protein [Paenibacillus radicis (ex Xue et al. 2023)]